MREIKFRGKRVGNSEWVEGDIVRHYENQRRFITCDQLAYTATVCGIDRLVSERYHEVDPATVGQYTGLKDKNGVDIYEGDVYHQGDRNILYVVEYTHDCSFMGRQIRTKGSFAGLAYWQDRIEVIGNIHENPDLLGKS